jgi:hypothetical protein
MQTGVRMRARAHKPPVGFSAYELAVGLPARAVDFLSATVLRICDSIWTWCDLRRTPSTSPPNTRSCPHERAASRRSARRRKDEEDEEEKEEGGGGGRRRRREEEEKDAAAGAEHKQQLANARTRIGRLPLHTRARCHSHSLHLLTRECARVKQASRGTHARPPARLSLKRQQKRFANHARHATQEQTHRRIHYTAEFTRNTQHTHTLRK